MQPKMIFITGTDTGVGKTLLTGLLLHHLRQGDVHALAMKPFCSGGTADVEFLQALQENELSAKEINPFYFAEPVAPLVAARKARRKNIDLKEVVNRIQTMAGRCEYLLIEGSGGVLVPLGGVRPSPGAPDDARWYSVADLIAKLDCHTIIVSRNRLGTINHTLLTVKTLQHVGIQRITVVLMDCRRRREESQTPPLRQSQPPHLAPHESRPASIESGSAEFDPSTRSNPALLAEILAPIRLIKVPYLGQNPLNIDALKNNAKKMKKVLARIPG